MSPLKLSPLKLSLALATIICTLFVFSASPTLAARDKISISAKGPIVGDGFSQVKAELLAAIAAGDAEEIEKSLEAAKGYDNRELARIVVGGCLQHSDLLVHKLAMELLGGLKSPEAWKYIAKQAASAKRWEIRAHCTRVLTFYGNEFSLDSLVKPMKDKKWQVRSAAFRGMHRIRKIRTVNILIESMEKQAGRIRADIVHSLKWLTGENFEDDAENWKVWWQIRQAEGYFLPELQKIKEKFMKKNNTKDLGTAVAEGLYGPIYSENIAFLVDVSGSMLAGTEDGSRLSIAVRELTRVLENQITKDTRYNIIAFADQVTSLEKKLVRGKASQVKKTIKKLAKLRAYGETNAFGALDAAFKNINVDTIYLLSDGSPTQGEETIPELIRLRIQKMNRDRRVIVNCIGFFPGAAKNQDKEEAREFLKMLAQENEGWYKEIR